MGKLFKLPRLAVFIYGGDRENIGHDFQYKKATPAVINLDSYYRKFLF
jgi:hypothetical protein